MYNIYKCLALSILTILIYSNIISKQKKIKESKISEKILDYLEYDTKDNEADSLKWKSNWIIGVAPNIITYIDSNQYEWKIIYRDLIE